MGPAVPSLQAGWAGFAVPPLSEEGSLLEFPLPLFQAIHTSSSSPAPRVAVIRVLFGNTLLEQQRSEPSALARVGGSLSALPTSCSAPQRREHPPGG